MTIAGWQEQQQEQQQSSSTAAAAAGRVISKRSCHHCAAVGQEDHAFVAGVHEVGGGATFLEPIIGSGCWESGDFENIRSEGTPKPLSTGQEVRKNELIIRNNGCVFIFSGDRGIGVDGCWAQFGTDFVTKYFSNARSKKLPKIASQSLTHCETAT